MYVKKCHTPPTKRANWFLSSYEPSRWVGEASWWNAMPFFSYFVASETHPSPEISHFFTKPTWTTGCFYLVCWSLQVSDVNKGIDSFHGSTNPCHDLKRHHLRNTCVWNDIRTVCADTDMSMFGCTCTCWYRSEGPELAYISWWFIPITLEQLHVLLSLALLKVWSFYIPLPLASSRWENCWLIAWSSSRLWPGRFGVNGFPSRSGLWCGCSCPDLRFRSWCTWYSTTLPELFHLCRVP